MWAPLRILTRAAFRDRISLFWSVLFPVGLLAGLGIAFPDPGYRQLLLIGVMVFSAVSFAAMGTAFVVMAQRRQGVYKLLRATPYRTAAFVANLAAARGLVTLASVALVAAAGAVGFGIPLAPAAVLRMVPGLALGILCCTLIGFVVGNLAGSEPQVSMINNLIFLPMFFASEMFYRLDGAPAWVRAVSRLLPVQHLVTALRSAVSGDGTGMLPALAALLVWTGVALGLAVATFRWDPDGPVVTLPRPGRARAVAGG
ncbi:MAG: ABC transporter permease [Firmicutes bacterium]|nr:ABC transporter permease [Bacillota bacterium]